MLFETLKRPEEIRQCCISTIEALKTLQAVAQSQEGQYVVLAQESSSYREKLKNAIDLIREWAKEVPTLQRCIECGFIPVGQVDAFLERLAKGSEEEKSKLQLKDIQALLTFVEQIKRYLDRFPHID